MSLATRCTTCGTAFRVVQDQLKVSEGWVRCGQCRAVFSAFEQLFDLERDGARVRPEPQRERAPASFDPALDAPQAPDGHGSRDVAVAQASGPSTRPPPPGESVQPVAAATDAAPAVEVIDAELPQAPFAAPDAPSSTPAQRLEEGESASADREDAGPPTIYAALDEPTMVEAADAPIEPAPTYKPAAPVHALEEPREAGHPSLPALDLDANDDDESPLLPPLETEASSKSGKEEPDAPFLAPEVDAGIDREDTIRLPEVSSASLLVAPAREPDVAVDEWAVQAAHERPSPIEKDIDAHLFGKRRHARRHAPAVHVSARDQLDFSDARFDSNLLTDEETLEGDVPPTERGELPLETAHPPAMPEFLRSGERHGRWQRPAVRVALWGSFMVLAVMLVLQATHHFRDDLAARWPALKPALVAWCGLASCALEAPRHIDDITVENTALARASADAFRLAVTLRNHAAVPLALPAVDLSLTDGSGRLVARRALSARDFKVSPAVLPPNGEVALEAPIAARNARVSGYTVEIFYP